MGGADLGERGAGALGAVVSMKDHALDNVGAACRHIGDPKTALDHHRQAITLARDTGNNYLLARALNNSGETVQLFKPDSPQIPPHPDAGFVPYVLLESVTYSNAAPWPTNADGAGIVQAIGPLKALAGSDPNASASQRFLIVTDIKDPSQVVLRQVNASASQNPQ